MDLKICFFSGEKLNYFTAFYAYLLLYKSFLLYALIIKNQALADFIADFTANFT